MTQSIKRKAGRKPTRGAKPGRPHPDYPLTANGNGQWSKKIKGRVHYFGAWGEPDKALAKWNREKDYLLEGKTPPRDDQTTIKSLGDVFMNAKRRQVDAGELTERSWAEYKRAYENVVEAFGRFQIVETLTPEAFGKLRTTLAAKWGPTTLGNELNRIRVAFKWGYVNGLIEKPVRYGDQFARPSKKRQRMTENRIAERMFEAEQLRTIIDAAGVQMKAWILLALNCGYGQHDLACLPRDRLDLDKGWATFPRPKKAAPRRCPLWKETIEAVEEAIKSRPEPKEPRDAGLVFVTRQGRRLVRKNTANKQAWIDSVGLTFGKLLNRLGLKQDGVNFYSLRRTHRTIADALRDDDACALIMGHIDDSDMGQRYVQRIDDDRLRAVTDHVRAWLFSPGIVARKSIARPRWIVAVGGLHVELSARLISRINEHP